MLLVSVFLHTVFEISVESKYFMSLLKISIIKNIDILNKSLYISSFYLPALGE